jgi:multisubunit Na+/H+ antiporter MnhE subunit
VRFVAGWIALFWGWLLLVGEWNRTEWIAASVVATVAGGLGEVAARRARVRPSLPSRWIARAWSVPHMVVVDFAIVMWALGASLVRREVVRGRFVRRDFPVVGTDPRSQGIRAWAAVAATFSPNAYVVDLDREERVALVHDLVVYPPSESPV